jgi:predicted DNA-binding ribbon-helix-helix protein
MTKVIKRSVKICGHNTSLTLEDEFYTRLKQLAAMQHLPLGGLIAQIEETVESQNLSSAARVYVLEHEADRLGY